MVVISILTMIIGILAIVCMWRIYTKAGYSGWVCLIPFYNMYVWYKIAKLPGLLFLANLLALPIPVLAILTTWRVGKAFGMSAGLCILAMFFPLVLPLCVAFNPYAEYDF